MGGSDSKERNINGVVTSYAGKKISKTSNSKVQGVTSQPLVYKILVYYANSEKRSLVNNLLAGLETDTMYVTIYDKNAKITFKEYDPMKAYKFEGYDLYLIVTDANKPKIDIDKYKMLIPQNSIILVINYTKGISVPSKMKLKNSIDNVYVSMDTGSGMDELRELIIKKLEERASIQSGGFMYSANIFVGEKSKKFTIREIRNNGMKYYIAHEVNDDGMTNDFYNKYLKYKSKYLAVRGKELV